MYIGIVKPCKSFIKETCSILFNVVPLKVLRHWTFFFFLFYHSPISWDMLLEIFEIINSGSCQNLLRKLPGVLFCHRKHFFQFRTILFHLHSSEILIYRLVKQGSKWLIHFIFFFFIPVRMLKLLFFCITFQ